MTIHSRSKQPQPRPGGAQRMTVSQAWSRLAICSVRGHQTRTGAPGACMSCGTPVARTADERYAEVRVGKRR